MGLTFDQTFRTAEAYVADLAHKASELIREEAQVALQAHAEAAQNYLTQLDIPDYHPFGNAPAGTKVRNLPGGYKLLSFPDGTFLQVSPDGPSTFAGPAGIQQLEPENGKLILPNGQEIYVNDGSPASETAGIEGLPPQVQPTALGGGRFKVQLSGNIRLDISQPECRVTLINPSSVVLLSWERIEGLAETVGVDIVGKGKRFVTDESQHRGYIEKDGTIHLSLANGQDLIIRWPVQDRDEGIQSPRHFQCAGLPV